MMLCNTICGIIALVLLESEFLHQPAQTMLNRAMATSSYRKEGS